MIDAQLLATLPAIEGDPPSVVLFGRWFPREGDHARFTVESVANLEADFKVELFHKNLEDTGDGTANGTTNIAFNGTTGRTTTEWTGLKELVRFRLTLKPNDNAGIGNIGWVLFRFLKPVWFEAVAP